MPPSPDEIRAFRKEHGLTQKALATALGGRCRAVEDWEAGRRRPPAMLRLAFAAIAAEIPAYQKDPDHENR